MSTTVLTNNIPRELLRGDEIPFSLFLENGQFHYVIAEFGVSDPGFSDYRFFKYRGEWYDYNEFTRISTDPVGFEAGVEPESPLAQWQGIEWHTMDSGVVVRLAEDETDMVIVGRFY